MSKQGDAQLQITFNPHDDSPFHLKSKATLAKPDTNSLRATIPEGIVAFLNLTDKDKLGWRMEIIDGVRVAIVKKLT